MLETLELPFVQRGLLELLILAVPAGLLGTWIVLRGLAFFSHAVGTAAFPGLVLADGLGFAAPLGAFAAAVAFTLGNAALGRGRDQGRDSVVALVLVACLAGGVMLASDVFGSGANVETLLFGSLLLVDGSDLVLAAVAAAATLAANAVVGRRWLAHGFDPGARPASRGEARLLDAAAAGPDRAGDHGGADRRRRPPGRLPVRRPRRHRPPGDRADAQLAARQRRPGRGRGGARALALGRNRRAAGGDDRLRRRRPSSRSWRWAGRSARAPRAPAALAAAALALALLAAGCGAAGSEDDGQLEVVATTTQIGDWVREVGGERGRGRPGAPAEHRPARVRAAAERRRGGGRRRAGLRQRRRPRLLDRGDRLRQRQRRDGRRPRRRRAGAAAGRGRAARRPRAYDPHWWHDPRNAEAAVRGDRAPPRRRRPRRTGPSSSATPTPTSRACGRLDAGIAALHRRGPGRRAQAGHRPRRLRLLRQPLRDRRRRRGHPLADDPGPALGQGRQRADRADRARRGEGGLPGELAQRQGGRGDRRARPGPAPTTSSTATRSGRTAPTARPT